MQQASAEAAADRKARRQAELNQREIDREARRRKLFVRTSKIPFRGGIFTK